MGGCTTGSDPLGSFKVAVVGSEPRMLSFHATLCCGEPRQHVVVRSVVGCLHTRRIRGRNPHSAMLGKLAAVSNHAPPGEHMATHSVNLDALIKREDFEIADAQQSPSIGGNLKLSELEGSSIALQLLRKPDFQRETKNWTPAKVAELVRGFVDGELIPAVIMWRSEKSGNIFVVDGAHRLSAFIAWIHDDYGDNSISKAFFGSNIPPEQEKAANETRELIRKSVGPYQLLKQIAQNQSSYGEKQVKRAKNAGVLPIEVQWVKGDASQAEASFFTINQSATEIHPMELRIIKARKKPNAIAARAIMRAGSGHRYWSDFGQQEQGEIESIAKEVYDLLFDPSLDTPIKTLDLPLAGRGYSADSLSLVVEFINVANNLKTEMWLGESIKKSRGKNKAKERTPAIPDDADGSVTTAYLKAVRRIASRITGNQARSLGLHPAVYFYSATGRYQPAALLAMVAMIQDMEKHDGFFAFTRDRKRFEDFLVRYKYFINQIVKVYGSGTRSLDPIVAMYQTVLKGIEAGLSDEKIADFLQQHDKLKYLKVAQASPEDRQSASDFSSEAKSAAFFRKALEEGAVRCGICGARVHVKSISIDHKTRKQDGGSGHSDNAQVTHPYCNTGYKEKLSAKKT